MVTPHFVKAYADSSGNVTEVLKYEPVRQVISEQTSKTILEIMSGGITIGSTKNAGVSGYLIGAKTGTSQKRAQLSDGAFTPYVSSCIAFAPINDPKLVMFIAIDEPDGQSREFYGGLVAAPVISKVLTEVLPYMQIPKTQTEEKDKYSVFVEDFKGKTVEEAKEIITKAKLNYKIVGNGNIILTQLPVAGEKITEKGKIILYTGKEAPVGVAVPNLIGLSPEMAAKKLQSVGLNLKVIGAYKGSTGVRAITQSMPAGTAAAEGTAVVVEFKNYDVTD